MSSAASGNGEGASNTNRVSISRGMYPYVATEKDCVDEEGKEAECVICLEDFEAGDKMARLACWCKFHEVRLFHKMHVRRLTNSRRASNSGGIRRDEVHAPRTSCQFRRATALKHSCALAANHFETKGASIDAPPIHT